MMIERVEIIKDEKEKFPFLCPICKQVDVTKEYLRFFISGQVNPSCIHCNCFEENYLK